MIEFECNKPVMKNKNKKKTKKNYETSIEKKKKLS